MSKDKLMLKMKESNLYKEARDLFYTYKNRTFDFEMSNKKAIIMLGMIVSLFAGDQITKYLCDQIMVKGQSYEIIDNFFYFTYVHNEGMAWSLLSGARWLFVIVTLVAIVGLAYFFAKTKKHEVLTRYGLVLVMAGALGNLWDRIILGYVRDFINFYIFSYDFPIFNVADICVCLGMGLIILEIIIQEYQIWKLSKSL